jgi:DNA repair exonuclease SbcCD ATPase subunit
MKFAKVQNPDGTWRKRSLSSLSGGQWRRCSLALSLGFIELASHRGKLRSSLLVLDEPLTHLDSAGRSSVGKLLRKMLSNSDESTSTSRLSSLGLSTILVILQDIAAEEIEECFDYIDEVVKSDGESYVVLQTDYITS